MKAVTWQGRRDMRVEEVPDPPIEQPTDAHRRDHLDRTVRLRPPPLRPPDPVHDPGRHRRPRADGHRRGGRLGVRPSRSATGSWFRSTSAAAPAGCATRSSTASARPPRTATTAPARACSATACSTGRSRVARPSCCACRSRTSCRSRSPHGPPDDRFLYLSDVLPTAWQAVEYAAVPEGGTLLVMGAGPIGDMAGRIALHRGLRVIVVDRVPERLARAAGRRRRDHRPRHGRSDVPERVRDLTEGRGADSVIDAVGMEAHGSPLAEAAQKAAGAVAEEGPGCGDDQKPGSTAWTRSTPAIECVRRGGTVSISGVYGGAADPMPMMQLFDKQLQIRMGQANVRRGPTTSSRCSTRTRTSSGPKPSPPTTSRWTRRPTRTRSSRRRKTAT